MGQILRIKHNMEMAHRLFLTGGKCENIHGHSWWVTVSIHADDEALTEAGMLLGMDFGDLKSELRRYMDKNFDHHLLLNKEDPFAQLLAPKTQKHQAIGDYLHLPGLKPFEGDPTTEMIAMDIGEFMQRELTETDYRRIECEVWETAVNCATWIGES
jgi:6-pyruvoyltetrahydropterin/6-carboxytetrahydropterin synthase